MQRKIFQRNLLHKIKEIAKKNAVKQKNIENKNEKRTQNTSNQGNRKYQIDYDHVIGGDENSQGKVTGGHSLLRGDVRIVKKKLGIQLKTECIEQVLK